MNIRILMLVLSLLTLRAAADEVPKLSGGIANSGAAQSPSSFVKLVTNQFELGQMVFCGSVARPVITNFPAPNLANPLIDYPGFLEGAKQVGELRKTHRSSEDEFRLMCEDPATVILDARSAAKFAMLHVKRAVNLSLPDMTADELAKIIPSKTTRVLIYCNNNFLNAPGEFPGKAKVAALNINTFNTLVGYGYTNVYELGPLLDVRTTKIAFEGTSADQVSRSTAQR